MKFSFEEILINNSLFNRQKENLKLVFLLAIEGLIFVLNKSEDF